MDVGQGRGRAAPPLLLTWSRHCRYSKKRAIARLWPERPRAHGPEPPRATSITGWWWGKTPMVVGRPATGMGTGEVTVSGWGRGVVAAAGSEW